MIKNMQVEDINNLIALKATRRKSHNRRIHILESMVTMVHYSYLRFYFKLTSQNSC